jgi:putative tryptophan/tyrosine transport system substrate-binding protein
MAPCPCHHIPEDKRPGSGPRLAGRRRPKVPGRALRRLRSALVQLLLVLGVAALLTGCSSLPFGKPKSAKVYRVGFMVLGSHAASGHFLEAYRQGLAELGYAEGRDIVIEARFADGQVDRLPEIAAELVGLKVNAIVVSGEQGIKSVKQATSTIPIVFVACDVMAAGLIESLARPGGNATGVTSCTAQTVQKRLDFLKTTLPRLQRVGALFHATDPASLAEWDGLQAVARTLGLELHAMAVREPDELPDAFEVASGHGTGGLLTLGAFTVTQRARIIDLAAHHRLPAAYHVREFADDGGLMAYGVKLRDQFRRAAGYTDKVLHGANPGDLPVEQPTTFDFIVNQKTARSLGLAIPQSIFAEATEVIQ